MRRIQSGQAGRDMVFSAMGNLEASDQILWRIGPIASPPARRRPSEPQRPSGIERNVVVTVRDWSDAKAYLHDLSGTDRNNPTAERLRSALWRARAQYR